MPISPGDRFGPYEIVEPLGAGGMGEVFKARDTRLGRFVALKTLSPRLSAHSGSASRFTREARSIAALQHSHICTLFDVGPDYLVMELLDGKPLSGPLPPPLVYDYSLQILDALHAAHSLGIIHRDLKPANILVTASGVKLLDFGLAKLLNPLPGDIDASTISKTADGQILGTLSYMAPEQLHGTSDTRSDLFSFGCVLYEMLSGNRAFSADSAAGIVAAILQRDPPPLQAPDFLQNLMLACLAKDPARRPQSALEARLLLEHSAPSAPAPSASTPLRRWPWVAAAAVVLTVAAYAIATFSPSPPAPGPSYRVLIHPAGGASIDPDAHVAVSPDGRKIAYVAKQDSGASIWIQSFDNPRPAMLPGTAGGRFPIWSPDSRSLAFQLQSTVMRVDLAGGVPAPVTQQDYLGGVWTRDNHLILGSSQGLVRVPVSGGQPSSFTSLDVTRGENFHNFPSELPNGKIIFRIRSTRPELSGIYVLDPTQPSDRRQILSTSSTALYDKGSLIWASGSSLVAQKLDEQNLSLLGSPVTVADKVGINSFGQLHAHAAGGALVADTASAIESQQLTWIGRDGKPLGNFASPAAIRWFRFAPQGRGVLASIPGPAGSSLWLARDDRSQWQQLTFLQGVSSHPVADPTGDYIVFHSQTPSNLFLLKSSDPQSPARILTSPNRQWPVDWSRDGKWILFYEADSKTQRDLWILPVDAARNPLPQQARPFLNQPHNEYMARFIPEPDPRFVLYLSNESGKEEVYLQQFPNPGRKVQISSGGATYPEWSADGKEIFFLSGDFWLTSVSLQPRDGVLSPSLPKRLFRLPIDRATSNPYAISPDGSRFLVPITTGRAIGPLEVIINWPSMFQK